MPYLGHFRFAGHFYPDIHQVANDGFHVTADITDLGELGGLHFYERRIGQPCQTPGNLGFADPGRTNHQDVLGRDFTAQRFIHLLPAPAVAQGNGDGAFGIVLAYDVFVQLLDNFAGCHFGHKNISASQHSSSSRVRLRLV